ncbi:tyrosine-type recombinase/integrase [Amphritea atlantica]|uniref:Tyrosine-type recombinase/integrase n=1 Tax=Amphritea atlantica TaxID=355243 RepID=A0ABY5GXZ7_9GAMM|nr:tyrosine-type recombinase/integrase [Amphritea atlantica]
MASPWKHPDSGIYYHRVGVPKDIRDQIGKSVIKYSLNTRDFTEAKRLFASHYADTQALFQQARNRTTLSTKDIETLAQRWLQAAVDSMEEAGDFENYLADFGGNITDASSLISDALEKGYKAQLRLVRYHVDTVLSDNNVLLTEGSDEYKALTGRICWRLMELSKIAQDRFYGNWKSAPEVAQRLSDHKLGTEKTKLNYKPLSVMVDDFTKYKTDRGDWSGKTLRDPVSVYEQFIEYIGADVDPHTITRDQLRDFVALLHQLPQRYTIIPRLKNKSLEKLVEIAADEELPLLSPTTVKKKFVFIKSLFSHAEQEEWVDKNRATGITVPKGKSKKRVPYRPEELQAIFDETRDAERPSDYWSPRISLATGMRSNEILQLTKADVQQANGVWFLDVNTDTDDETGKDKKAKTDNSQRKVPVPQVLIDAGFLAYVESIKEGRLFPCVALAAADGTYSFTYSKRFNPMLKRLGLKPSQDEMIIRDFHSFRHTFRSNARAYGIAKENAELIGGWKSQNDRTAGDNYGLHYDAFIAELKVNADKIDYSDITF